MGLAQFGSVWFTSVRFDSFRFGGQLFPIELELGE